VSELAGGADSFIEKILPYLPYMVCGVIIAGIGAFLIVDDAYDFGTFSTSRHPSPWHHWQVGLVLFIVGLVIIALSLYFALAQ